MVDLNPALPVICRPKDSSGAIHKIRAQKNVASGVDCEATFVQRRKSIVHLLPPLAAIGRPKHSDAVRASEQRVTRIDSYGSDLSRY